MDIRTYARTDTWTDRRVGQNSDLDCSASMGLTNTVAGTPSQIFFVFVFFWSWGGRTSLLSYLYCFVCVFMVIKTMKMAKIEQFWT